MSFEKWFKHYEEETGQNRFVCEDMQAAYEAGQRDMRERAIAECQKSSCKYVHPLEHLPIVDCIDAIRVIKLESEQ